MAFKISHPSQMDTTVIDQEILDLADLPPGDIKQVELQDGYKVLLINNEGIISALANTCTHYGAPLINGDKIGNTIRCPWHGACFNTITGDIEEFPGLDSLKKYDTTLANGKIRVRANVSDLTQKKRTKGMVKFSEKNTNVVLLIGGGPASTVCAETLRQEGYDGKILMACKERFLPYDRPKGSKAMDTPPEIISLRKNEFYEDNGIQVLLGKEVISIDIEKKQAEFQDGSRQTYDQLLLATGAECRTLPIPGNDLTGLYTLRTMDEANAIFAAAKDKTVAIIGASFIGMEVSSCLVKIAKSVTCIGNASHPFPVLGKEVGMGLKEFSLQHGVKFELGVRVEAFIGEEGELKGVKLSEGKVIPCDIAVVAVGVRPSTDFLIGSGINLNKDGSISTNEFLAVKPDIFAAGDIAMFPSPFGHGESVRIEHWQIALNHGRVVAMNILKRQTPVDTVPYFWTVLFGKSVRYCGYSRGYDKFVFEGSISELKFVGYYLREGKLVAVVGLNSDPKVSHYANTMKIGQFPTLEELRQTTTLNES
ncbi:Apoptosis-inducing factor 3-like isoform X1 [Oopsacas minuta]|uniref:Apoptosis-inducing factor 3-like isoform X1 n=1 Tax=Oopsacas minuta TaxID=111878 RepID=A0AAV7JVC5_9METZ|nr:Apoptosis-inducing factor 3-like isoform X1 [Oopsacas minuta]